MRIAVDTSALVAILLGEPEREAFHRLLLTNEPVMSVASVAETFMVAQGRLGAGVLTEVEEMLADYRVEIASVTPADLAELRHAVLAYGKGRRAEPAVLNFGDIFAYALAKRLQLPLLFKGQDFAATDITRAVSPP